VWVKFWKSNSTKEERVFHISGRNNLVSVFSGNWRIAYRKICLHGLDLQGKRTRVRPALVRTGWLRGTAKMLGRERAFHAEASCASQISSRVKTIEKALDGATPAKEAEMVAGPWPDLKPGNGDPGLLQSPSLHTKRRSLHRLFL